VSRDHELATKAPAKKNLAEEIEERKATKAPPPEPSAPAKKTVGFAKKPAAPVPAETKTHDEISL
jgi:hypothetical protein